MKELKFVPEGFDGHVILKVPNFKERAQIAKELNLQIGPDGSVDRTQAVDMMGKLYDIVERHIASLEIKIEDTVFTSLEDVTMYKEGNDLINKVGAVLMGGLSLKGE